MADRDLIERFDRHLGRSDEIIERNTEALERINGEFELNREVQGELLIRIQARLSDCY